MNGTYDVFEKLVKEKGCSVSDVARATGITRSLFSDWKSGRTNPKLDKLVKLSAFFNVPLSVFTETQADFPDGSQVDFPNGSQVDFVSEDEKALAAIRAILGVKPQPEGTPVYYKDEETARLAQEALENQELRMLLDASRGLSPEDIRAIIEIAKRMKGTAADG